MNAETRQVPAGNVRFQQPGYAAILPSAVSQITEEWPNAVAHPAALRYLSRARAAAAAAVQPWHQVINTDNKMLPSAG
jgi:hypothetical protein